MTYFLIIFLLIGNCVLCSDYSKANYAKDIHMQIIKTYTFKINSNYFKRENVLKLTYFSLKNSNYETSYIYESKDGLEKLYHDFNSSMSVVQRLYYEFPTPAQLAQFLATGDMSFNSYLFVDMDVDYLQDSQQVKSISVSDAVISFGLQGKDLIANNFNIADNTTLIDVDFNIPYSFNAF